MLGIIHDGETDGELKFLRYFYSEASYAMGPADSDIYDMIKQEFFKENGYLPEGYEAYEEDEEPLHYYT